MLECVALHRLVVGPPPTADYIGAAQPDRLEAAAAQRLQTYLDNLSQRSEGQGRAQAAWWLDGEPAELERLLACDVPDFDAASRSAMDRLVGCTPSTAQSGVIIFVRVRAGESRSLMCLKMVLSREELALFRDTVAADQAIHIEDITNKLPEAKELKKAALIPHPTSAADLRVVDEQMEEPAEYWLQFLGARARRKEPEIAKLTVAAAAGSLRDRGIDEARVSTSIGASLEEAIAHGRDEKPQEFARRVARHANVPGRELWSEMTAKQEKLLEPEARVTPRAAQLLKTTITLEHDIKITGLSRHLDTRYTIEAAGDGEEGWIVRVRSAATEPSVKRTIVPGRQ